MVVPLHTLPGWPASPNPPWLALIGLLLGIPLAVVIVFSLIGKLTAARHAPSAPALAGDKPLWLGGPEGAGVAVPGGERIALPASVTRAEAEETIREHAGQQVGGASARW